MSDSRVGCQPASTLRAARVEPENAGSLQILRGQHAPSAKPNGCTDLESAEPKRESPAKRGEGSCDTTDRVTYSSPEYLCRCLDD